MTPLGDLANVFKAFIGANFLSIPFAVKSFGLALSLCVLLMIAVATRLGVYLLVWSKRSLSVCANSSSYGFVAERLLGVWAFRAVETCLLLTQFGFCVGYVIFVSQTLSELLPLGTAWCIVIVGALEAGLGLIRSVKLLSPFSAIANITLFSAFVMCVIYETTLLAERGVASGVQAVDWSGFPLFFGMATSAYEGIGCILPVENGMGRENKPKFFNFLDLSLVGLSTILVLFGTTSYLCFGDSLHDIIVQDIANNSWLVGPLKVCLIIGILLTYPLQMLPVFRILERILLTVANEPERQTQPESTEALLEHSASETGEIRKRNRRRKRRFDKQLHLSLSSVLRLSIVVATAILAFVVPSFHSIVSLVGSFGSAFLAFILPPFLYLSACNLRGEDPPRSQRYALYALVVFGIAGGNVGTFYSIRDVLSLQ